MVHCRSAMGAWKHAQRSYQRGYLSRPPVFVSVEMPPPPPPPVFYGVELPGPRVRLHWDDLLLDEEDDWHIGKDAVVAEPLALVDAPLSDKDVSLPRSLCLDVLCATNVPSTPQVSQSTCDTEGRNEAILKELKQLKILLASMQSDSNCLRAEFDCCTESAAELKRTLKSDMAGLSEACYLAVEKCFGSATENCNVSAFEDTAIEDTVIEEEEIGDGPKHECPNAAELEDFDYTVDEVYLGLQSLRVFCFPLPIPFAWNTNARKFLLPLPENPEEGTSERAMFALPCVEFYSELLEHVEANKEDHKCTVFDESGDCSRANLSLSHNRLKNCKYTNVRDCDDPKPVLCKIMNLIEFAPQNYLKSFTECLLGDLNCMKEFDVVSLELVYSNQKRLKRYNFSRSNLFDCEYNDSACFSSFSACSATGHDQSYVDEGDEYDLDTQGPFYHA